MNKNTVLGLLVTIMGLFSVVCAALNFDWFFANHRARPIVAIFGRTGARLFYVALGTFICYLGVAWFLLRG